MKSNGVPKCMILCAALLQLILDFDSFGAQPVRRLGDNNTRPIAQPSRLGKADATTILVLTTTGTTTNAVPTPIKGRPETLPAGTAEFKGHHYLVSPERLTWKDAEKKCKLIGGHLVTLSDSAEFEFVRGEKAKFATLFDSLFFRNFTERYGTGYEEKASRRDNTWIGATCEGWEGGLKSTSTATKRRPELKDLRWVDAKPGFLPDESFTSPSYEYKAGQCYCVWGKKWGGQDSFVLTSAENLYGYICEWDY